MLHISIFRPTPPRLLTLSHDLVEQSRAELWLVPQIEDFLKLGWTMFQVIAFVVLDLLSGGSVRNNPHQVILSFIFAILFIDYAEVRLL